MKKLVKTAEKLVKNEMSASSTDANNIRSLAKELGLEMSADGNLITMNCPGVIDVKQSEKIDLRWYPGSGVNDNKIHRYKQAVFATKAYIAAANDNLGDLKNIYTSMDVEGRVMFHYLATSASTFKANSLTLENMAFFVKVNNFMLENYAIDMNTTKIPILNWYVSWHPGQVDGVVGTEYLKAANKNWNEKILAQGGKVLVNAKNEAEQNLVVESKSQKVDKTKIDEKSINNNSVTNQDKLNKAESKLEKQIALEVELQQLVEATKLTIQQEAKERAEKAFGRPIDAEALNKIIESANSKNEQKLEVELKKIGMGVESHPIADSKFYEAQLKIIKEGYSQILTEEFDIYINKVKEEEKALNTNNNLVTNPYKLTDVELKFVKKFFDNGHNDDLNGTAKAAIGLIIGWNSYSASVLKKDANANNLGVNKLAKQIFKIIKESSDEDLTIAFIKSICPASFKELQEPYKLTDEQVDFGQQLLQFLGPKQNKAMDDILKDNLGGGNGGEHNTYNDQFFAAFIPQDPNDVQLSAAILNSTSDYS